MPHAHCSQSACGKIRRDSRKVLRLQQSIVSPMGSDALHAKSHASHFYFYFWKKSSYSDYISFASSWKACGESPVWTFRNDRNVIARSVHVAKFIAKNFSMPLF
jgi:hypothetical protein